MTRYYFDHHEGGDLLEDTVGIDYPDLVDARAEALQALAERVADLSMQREISAPFALRLQVRTDEGTLFATQAVFSEVDLLSRDR